MGPDAPTADQRVDVAADLPVDLPQNDMGLDFPPIPDIPWPDSFVTPDGGCPAGLTDCNGACVDPATNNEHCGACFTKCDPGKDCVSGSCLCIAGGSCSGCCSSSGCVQLGDQSTMTCGINGATCVECQAPPGPQCNAASCTQGVCGVGNVTDGTVCNDKNDCSYDDVCMGGTCKGTAYSCTWPCASAACTGMPPPNECGTPAIDAGWCFVDGSCHAHNGTAGPCFHCDTSKSNTALQPAPNSGCVHTVAGVPGVPGNTNMGAAQFHGPMGLSIAGDTLYIADTDNNMIRTINLVTKVVSTLAGTGTPGYTSDGPASTALLNRPHGVYAHSNAVYFADTDNHVIRVVQNGMVKKLAGVPGVSGTASPTTTTADAATFDGPQDVVVIDPAGKLTIFVADTNNGVVRRISMTNDSVNNAAITTFTSPTGLFYDSLKSNELGVVEMGNNRLMRLTLAAGIASLLAGSNAGSYGYQDGAATSGALFHNPRRMAANTAAGGADLYIADGNNHRIRKYTPQPIPATVSTEAGSGTAGHLDGPKLSAQFNEPSDVVVDIKGYIYVADTLNHCIRVIYP